MRQTLTFISDEKSEVQSDGLQRPPRRKMTEVAVTKGEKIVKLTYDYF